GSRPALQQHDDARRAGRDPPLFYPKRRLPLYIQLLLWLLLNLALLAGLYASMPGSGGSAWAMLLSQPVRERLADIGERIALDLSAQAEAQSATILASYRQRYGVDFMLVEGPENGPAGPPPGGRDHGPHGGPPGGPPPFGDGGDRRPPEWEPGGPAGEPPPPPMQGRSRETLASLVYIARGRSRIGGEPGYQVTIPAKLARSGEPSHPITIRAQAGSLLALLSFLGVREWVTFALLALLLSILLWWPFIWSITRTVGQLTSAAQRIAEGRFDTRVRSRRRDELGALAEAVNRMAERLQSHVAGQKQFVADVAHEVTSPLARVQVGLAILESKLGESGEEQLRDVHDDVQQMSELLNELLLFSRAGLESDQAPLRPVLLADAIAGVLVRDDAVERVQAGVDSTLSVMAQPSMLTRALSNLVRNALRYGGDAGAPIEIAARREGGDVLVTVADRGPGVPSSALPHLGEPFFRTDEARTRESGGYGLGLTIVRRCAEACGGSAQFRNRAGGGFEAELRLKAAS
ncbi:MAG: sensor histidine kinase, partial [Hydrocarboniphaga sp.]|uniref:sensor histidine kinase n=1 Tax=Hydrocarboniphaga sp. TaxID=2033016 RepID=UPI002608A8B8